MVVPDPGGARSDCRTQTDAARTLTAVSRRHSPGVPSCPCPPVHCLPLHTHTGDRSTHTPVTIAVNPLPRPVTSSSASRLSASPSSRTPRLAVRRVCSSSRVRTTCRHSVFSRGAGRGGGGGQVLPGWVDVVSPSCGLTSQRLLQSCPPLIMSVGAHLSDHQDSVKWSVANRGELDSNLRRPHTVCLYDCMNGPLPPPPGLPPPPPPPRPPPAGSSSRYIDTGLEEGPTLYGGVLTYGLGLGPGSIYL